MVTVDYDGVSTTIDDNLDDCAQYMGHTSICQFHMVYTVYGIYMVYTGCSIKLVLLEKF